MAKKLNGTVIVTYRCNARCTMCNRYKCPSKPEEEISIETLKKLPEMYFTNITGGEPFIREDLPEIVRELYKKSDRIVISTNGFLQTVLSNSVRNFRMSESVFPLKDWKKPTMRSVALRMALTEATKH